MAELSPLLELLSARARGEVRGVSSVCSAHPAVLQAALEQALETGDPVLVESTSNQVNQEGGYTGVRPAEFAAFVERLAEDAELPPGRVILGGDHLGPHPWRELGATIAMARAGAMVRDYVRAGYAKIHLDASMACADDPLGPLAETVAAARTAELAAAAESAAAERPPGGPPRSTSSARRSRRPAARRAPTGAPSRRAPRTRSGPSRSPARPSRDGASSARSGGSSPSWSSPASSSATTSVFPYRREGAAGLAAVADAHGLVYEAHSTDYQDEEALRALVEDRFAVLKVGPELTFAFREAVFALEAIERELLGRGGADRLSGVGLALDDAMRSDPRHWKAWYERRRGERSASGGGSASATGAATTGRAPRSRPPSAASTPTSRAAGSPAAS